MELKFLLSISSESIGAVKEIFCRFQKNVRTDNGGQYISTIFEEYSMQYFN